MKGVFALRSLAAPSPARLPDRCPSV